MQYSLVCIYMEINPFAKNVSKARQQPNSYNQWWSFIVAGKGMPLLNFLFFLYYIIYIYIYIYIFINFFHFFHFLNFMQHILKIDRI